ncbi:MAG: hypothetical protein ACOX4D_06795 [Bacteroidales bacterium]
MKLQFKDKPFDVQQLFVKDGFYPYYTYQKRKILFIGREALEIGGANYMELLYEAYLEDNIGGITLNRYKFHYTMLYITYAIEHGEYKWNNIPYASDFISEFAQPNGISNAFMNLSKFSNESGEWPADNDLIQTFLEASSKSQVNFFAKEIDLLSPGIIIGMNHGERMKYLGTFSSQKMYNGKDVCFQYLHTPSGKSYPYLDCWHFSSRKTFETDIFNPIIEALLDNNIITSS